MKRRYVICFDELTKSQSLEVKDFLEENDLSWWHWIGNTWFVVDDTGLFTASKIRDSVKKIARNERIVVIEINEQDDTWSGVRVNDPDHKMFKWFHELWKK